MAVNGSEAVRQLSQIELMGHLFRRAGFGATRDELEAVLAKGYEATLEEFLHPAKAPDLEEDLLFRYSQAIGMFVEIGRGMSNPYEVAPVGGLRIGIGTLDEDYLGEWGTYGTGPGQLVWPDSMVLDAHGRLLISDEWRHDIQIYERV